MYSLKKLFRAGNCNVMEHTIKIKDSNPIKQTPRRIPFRLRKKVR